MKKTNQRQKRVAALSLATIISLNMTNIALAEPNIAIPEVSTSVEVKEIKEKEKIQEVEETESLEVEEIQTLEIEDEKEEESLEIEGKRPQDKEQKEEVKEPKTYIKKNGKTELESFSIKGNLEGKSIQTLEAGASSVNGVLYKFYIKDLSTNKWTMIQDYSEENTATWVPEKAGNYWYGVHIKDKESKEAKDTHLYKNVTIKSGPLISLTDFTISGRRYTSQNHTLTADAVSDNGVLYKFYIKDLSTNKWTMIQDYSEKNTATWKPKKA
ncbi:MAG: hypothetical protein ACTHW2_05970, partial [Tissierella sp.]|uniref:hypothetical protein n=1 Tax=Tissierella sp. TaxID=41274 RepID=UPI003F9745FF